MSSMSFGGRPHQVAITFSSFKDHILLVFFVTRISTTHEYFRTTMAVRMPKFQKDIPTLVQVLVPVTFYHLRKKLIMSYCGNINILKYVKFGLQAEVRVSTNSLCGRRNPY